MAVLAHLPAARHHAVRHRAPVVVNLGALSTARQVSLHDSVSPRDRQDLFAVQVQQAGTLSVTLTKHRHDAANLLLLGGNLGVLGLSHTKGTRPETITASVSPGTYYLEAKAVGNAGAHYTLSMAYVPRSLIQGTYQAIWSAVGPGNFGQALSGPVTLPGQNIEYQPFQNGVIVGPVGEPAIPLFGDLYQRWQSLGGFGGPFGAPVSAPDTFVDPTTHQSTVMQDFQNGWMLSNPTAGNLAVTGGSTADFPLLVGDASMLGPGLSLTDPKSLGLWDPISQAIKQAGSSLSRLLNSLPGYDNLRTNGTLPAALPAPFHYDPNLVSVTGVQEKFSWYHDEFFNNGTTTAWYFYGSTRAGHTAYWSNQAGRTDVVNQVESRLNNMVPSDAIRVDPVFSVPVKFLMVDQIFDSQGNPLPTTVGRNDFEYKVWTSGTSLANASAARVIEIKQWNDPAEHEQAIRTFVHEIGHSWDIYQAPTQGLSNTPWLQYHAAYFNQFMGLSGWTQVNGTWTHSAPASAFASAYAMTNPNEDWAETFELASRDPSGYGLSATLNGKVNLVLRFLRQVVPSEASLGGLNDELLTGPAPNT